MTSNLGTTAWCAPELLTATNKTRYSVKVDVYSFGMVLWELWERKRPYEELYSRFDIIDAVREGRRPAINSTCPPTFRSLIQRCWHEQPARRPTFAYIVRYIKDELAHIKRQRMSSASNFSPLHQLLLGPRTKSSTSGGTTTSPDIPGRSEDTTPSQSVDDDRSKHWLQRGLDHSIVRHNIQSDETSSGNTRTSYIPPTVNLPTAPLAMPQTPSQENLDMLASSPWTNDSEYSEVPPVVEAQNRTVHQAAGKNAWRDKYVMRFNGWKSSDPDTGLPPSAYSSGGGLGHAHSADTMESAVAAPPPVHGEGGNRSPVQGLSVDSGSDTAAVIAPSVPSLETYDTEDLTRLPIRSTDERGQDSRASGNSRLHHDDPSESKC